MSVVDVSSAGRVATERFTGHGLVDEVDEEPRSLQQPSGEAAPRAQGTVTAQALVFPDSKPSAKIESCARS